MEVKLIQFDNPSDQNRESMKAFVDNNYCKQDEAIWYDTNTVFLQLLLLQKLANANTHATIIGVTVIALYDKGSAHIRVMFVDSAWRNKGFGTHMLMHVAQMFPNKEITLSVTFADTHLLQFYRKRGYILGNIDTEQGLYVMRYSLGVT